MESDLILLLWGGPKPSKSGSKSTLFLHMHGLSGPELRVQGVSDPKT